MRRLLVTLATSALAVLFGGNLLEASHRGCGGGHGHHGCGSSCGGYSGGCGSSGGCGTGCGMSCGGYAGGCGSGCMTACGGSGCGMGCGGCGSMGYAAVVDVGGRTLVQAPEAKTEQTGEAQVTLVVNLPEDARLLVDGQPTRSTSATRVFTSPPVRRGVDFQYTLQAEVDRDGKTYSVTKQVIVRAGQERQVTLDVPVRVALGN